MSNWEEREERRRQRREWKRQMRGDPNSMACAVRGPITLITVGALFALQNFTPYNFGQTWPVLLIVFGLMTLVCRGTRQEVPPQAGPAAAPPYNYQAPPPASSGGYRQSQYSQPAASAAPPKAPESGQPQQGGSV